MEYKTRYFNAVLVKQLIEKKIKEHQVGYDTALNSSDEWDLVNWEHQMDWYEHQLELQVKEIEEMKNKFTEMERIDLSKEYYDQFKRMLVEE